MICVHQNNLSTSVFVLQSGKKEVIVMRLKQGIRYPGIEYVKSKILVFPFDSESLS